MDEAAIDQAYESLQAQFKDLARSLEVLAGKLQLAISHGDQSAREWLLDLKQVGLDVRAEQVQASELLQLIHGYVASSHAEQQMPTQRQQRGQGSGGLLGSRFGRAIETGAGFAIGEDLINSIF